MKTFEIWLRCISCYEDHFVKATTIKATNGVQALVKYTNTTSFKLNGHNLEFEVKVVQAKIQDKRFVTRRSKVEFGGGRRTKQSDRREA